MYVCPTRWPALSDVHRMREDIIADKKFQCGLLIDFDYATMLNSKKQGVSSGDRTGTIPFMAIDLLQEFTKPSAGFIHTFSHNLKSLIYVLIWICMLYQAPNEICCHKTAEQTCLKQWASAKTMSDIEALHDQKLGQLLSKTVFDHFTPYFEPMKPFVAQLYKLI
ncbi:hypothetical protein JVU11DRAFT_1087 [Chiua virens]|nr:hypothetical protein JVU11DRAFT_1087 [Chiua virens]